MKLESLLNEVVEWDVEILGLGDVIVMAPSETDARARVAKRLKKGKEGIGNIIHCLNYKSRLTRENARVDVKLTYDKGLDRYYGLLDLAIKHNIFKSVSTRIELPDGTKQYAKTINNEPDKFFTKDILNQIDKVAKKEFLYGQD